MNRKVIFVALLAFTARMILLLCFPGFGNGDDVELIEAGAKLAFGLPYEPWVIRSLVIPYCVLAPWLWLAKVAGVAGVGHAMVVLSVVPTAVVSSVTVVLVIRFGEAWGLGRTAALWGGGSMHSIGWR